MLMKGPSYSPYSPGTTLQIMLCLYQFKKYFGILCVLTGSFEFEHILKLIPSFVMIVTLTIPMNIAATYS